MKLLTLSALFGAAAAVPLTARANTASVVTPSGTVVGAVTGGVEYYRGVPYAQSPTGSLRLKAPKRLANFGTVEATGLGPSCPQFATADATLLFGQVLAIPNAQNSLFSGMAQGGDTEDCLTVSVMRPANTAADAKLPVLFYIHGGGYQFGSAQPYNASVIIPRGVSTGKPFILVAINYRLGAFGFLGGKEVLADGAANLGLLDQRMALEWVADNIASFGGNPDAVTIWGESAGAMSVFSQMSLYGGDNKYNGKALFRGAIMNSGSMLPAEPVDGAKAQGVFDTVAAAAGCDTAADKLACLRQADFATFAAASTSVPTMLGYHSLAFSYMPRPDGKAVPASADVLVKNGQYATVPVIIGNQEHEGTVFSVFQSNLSTKADTVSYMNNVFFPTASARDVEGLVNTYPASELSDPSIDASYDVYPEFKRVARIIGDYEFTLISRVLLDSIKDLKKSVKAWSYIATYENVPVLGTYHTSDMLRLFFGTDAVSTGMQDRYIAFVNSLDPNTNLPRASLLFSTKWPTWQSSRSLLKFSKNAFVLSSGIFRGTSFNYIKSHLNALRL